MRTIQIGSRLTARLCYRYSSRGFSNTSAAKSDYSHLVIGGGVVGLAVGAKLSARPGTSVLLLERHTELGSETSARNSEVIHAGIYYPPDSLKAKLCIRGKEMIYDIADKNGIEYQKCGKWIVSQSEQEDAYLEKLRKNCEALRVPVEYVSNVKAKELEPDVHARTVLASPTTGIISAHSLMTFLQGQLESNGGDIALETNVQDLQFLGAGNGFKVLAKSQGETVEFTVDNLVNSAGLAATDISNLILPQERHVKGYFARGSYFSYGLSKPKTKRLIYPVPSGTAGLGTHLTLDLGGQIKFGPNVEWTTDPQDVRPRGEQLDQAYGEIHRYLPGVEKTALKPDYAGIRPKIVGPGSPAADFYIKQEQGFPGFVNLLGIESPGLTASMAIGEYVDKLLFE